MIDTEQTPTDAVYPEWKPTDWTPRQRIIALVSLIALVFACALIACACMIWGTGPLALDTFIPIGATLLMLAATLLTSVFWYAYRNAHNTTGDGPEALSVGLIVMEFLAFLTLAFQVVGGILVATVGWEDWRGYSSLSYWGLAAIGGLFIFVLAVYDQKWRPTRDPSAPRNRLSAPAQGVRLLFRWAVMLLARNSWILIGGALAFDVTLFNQVSNQAQVDLVEPIVIFWCGAVFFLLAAVIELLPSRPSPDTVP